MFRSSHWSIAGVTLVTISLAAGTVFPYLPVSAQNDTESNVEANFPDTENHWAQPFIAALAERNIITGYLDGTYRPNRPVDRDEFAAIVRDAFSQNQERTLASGSVYKDVPENYWAAPAIEEAYEMGFMKGYPGGFFRPNQEVSRVEALVSLSQNLNLADKTTTTQTAAVPTQATAPAQPNNQPVTRQTTRKRYMAPMAMTALMQPLITPPTRAKSVPASSNQTQAATRTTPATTSTKPSQPVSVLVSQYYDDAARIPQYAVDDVANATKAGIVVNHPNPRLLNPTQPATRGEIAAFVHQALVGQGRLDPLEQNITASNYIVQGR
jgi:hypothetical protein